MTSIDELTTSLINHFEDVPDPRATRTRKHLLKDILVIAVLAVIAGAEGWEDIENYGISKQKWLEEFLALPNGIPSDDTFRRVFEKLHPNFLGQVKVEDHSNEITAIPALTFHSPRNFALLRRIALNALHQETTLKHSLRQKVKRAAMNNDYMMQILQCFCQA